MDEKTINKAETGAKESSLFNEGDLVKVTGGSASAKKTYRCPNCGSFCKATGEGVHIGSHSYYPTGLHWIYECLSCGKSYLECELDGTIPPWDSVKNKEQ